MAHKFSGKIIEKWGLTEPAILKSSDYLLYSYWSWKQKNLSSVLIFSPYSEGTSAAKTKPYQTLSLMVQVLM